MVLKLGQHPSLYLTFVNASVWITADHRFLESGAVRLWNW